MSAAELLRHVFPWESAPGIATDALEAPAVPVKPCKGCGVWKRLDDFHRHPNTKDGRQPKCKACVLAYVKERAEAIKAGEWAERSRVAARTEKRCPSCRFTKPLSAFFRASDRPDGRDAYCSACRGEKARRLEPQQPPAPARPRAGLQPPAITHTRPRPDWGDRAACTTADPSVFDTRGGAATTQALKLCGDCPVRLDCLLQSLAFEIVPGTVVAGMLPAQRRAFAADHPDLVSYRMTGD